MWILSLRVVGYYARQYMCGINMFPALEKPTHNLHKGDASLRSLSNLKGLGGASG